MRLVAHRGVPSLYPENTIKSILNAAVHKPDFIEFDVQITSDGQLVVMHDLDLKRMCGDPRMVKNVSFKEIKTLLTLQGEHIPSAEEALLACTPIRPAIEGKGESWASPLSTLLQKYPNVSPVIISDNADELAAFQQLHTDLQTFFINRRNPFRVASLAKKYGFSGIDVVFWCMNPLIYLHARKNNLLVATYTVPPVLTKLFSAIYPKALLTTNYIQKFSKRI